VALFHVLHVSSLCGLFEESGSSHTPHPRTPPGLRSVKKTWLNVDTERKQGGASQRFSVRCGTPSLVMPKAHEMLVL
jgi:hypothetical protein